MAIGFASYEIARSGLFVNERGLNVTGHNISNVNTPGFTRQQAIMKNAPYQFLATNNGLQQVGMGADIQEVRQIRHSFLDNIFRQENTTLGYWESRDKTFQDVQAIMGEPFSDSGLQGVLNQYWDSWQELSKEPDSLTVRALVRQRGEALVDHINHLGTQLDKLQQDLNSEIQVRIDEVNQITSQIAGLNITIMKNEVVGDSANDYRDQRNYLIDRLSKLVNADVNEMQDGQVDITVGGYYLVQKGNSTDMYAAERNAGDVFVVPKLAGTKIEIPLKSGIIKGLMESRGEVDGGIGSLENGTPDTSADVTFVVDTSGSGSGSFSAADFAAVKKNILAYADEMEKRGLNFNFTLVKTDSFGTTSTTYTKAQYPNFQTDVSGLTQNATAGDTSNTDYTTLFGNIDTAATGKTNNYAVLFTNLNTNATDTASYNTALNGANVKVSVVTDDLAAVNNWDDVTNAYGGQVYTGVTAATTIGGDITSDINNEISMVPNTVNIVSDMRKSLNALVNVLLREVNNLHRSGKTLTGADGKDFFEAINTGRPMEAGNIKLNDNLSNLNNIAASSDGSSGDNTVALAIANLRNKSMIQDMNGQLTPDGYYQAIILTMGNEGAEAARVMDSQSKLVQSADDSRTAISGVSMDEEMTNMMKYKFAYDASSRALNTIDQMMETIISRMGLVGR